MAGVEEILRELTYQDTKNSCLSDGNLCPPPQKKTQSVDVEL